VVRQADPKDRRVWRLQLTAAAAPVLKEIAMYRAELHDLVTAGIEPVNLEVMAAGLLRMKANLAAEVPENMKAAVP
jgi:DNA-binding MarR family transcriptional regulator